MPCHSKLKKDAQNCEKLRGAVQKRRSAGIRMGEPGRYHGLSSMHEHIVHERGTRGTETSKYPEEKKTTVISQVAASEQEEAQTVLRDGVEGPQYDREYVSRTRLKA